MGTWTNRRFFVDGMEFDAAIDYGFELHHYCEGEVPEGTIPVELYNCSKDWDIYMIYLSEISDEAIIAGIREWISLMPVEQTNNYPEESDYIDEYDSEDYNESYTTDSVLHLLELLSKYTKRKISKEELLNEVLDYDPLIYGYINKTF